MVLSVLELFVFSFMHTFYCVFVFCFMHACSCVFVLFYACLFLYCS